MPDSQDTDKPQAGVKFCRQVLHPLLALAALGCLLTLVGWTGAVTVIQHWVTLLIGIAFAMGRGWVFLKAQAVRAARRRLALHAKLGLIVLLTSLVLMLLPLASLGRWSLGAHLFIQLAVLLSGLESVIYNQTRITARAFHPGLVLIVSFLFIIHAGALLLKMPRCVVPGQTCSWLDAFFTSTSAVCVTGLGVQNTAQFFSLTGQVVIMLLIQVGGLGIMTLTFFAAVVLFEGLSLHDRLLVGRMLSENRLARVGRTLAFIVALTFICEGIGAVILFISLESVPELGMRLFHAVFHAVSAFCNAGFSTLPDGLASAAVQGNGIWQIVVMLLIIIGGLGTLACEDIALWAVAMVKRQRERRGPYPRLRVHSRLVLWVTAGLILSGAAGIYASEFLFWNGPQNGGAVLTAFFHSVTARTAGFNTVPMSQIAPLTAQFLMILMLIGGSPGGTAGGMRTTVFAVGIAHLWSQLRMSPRGMVVFNRTIPQETGIQALGVMVLTAIWLTVNLMIFIMLETGSGVRESSLLFELISAFGTVGLSLDLTPTLGPGAKILLIVNMFVGRIGLLTVFATLVRPNPHPISGQPEETILLT